MYSRQTIYTYGSKLHEHIGFDNKRIWCGIKHGKSNKDDLMWLTVLVAVVVAITCFALINKAW